MTPRSADPAATTHPTFASWLRRQRRRDDAVGDLARDVAADPLVPSLLDLSPVALLDHLASVGACPGALAAVTAAEREWKASR